MVKKPNSWLVVGLVAVAGYAGWSTLKPKPPAAAPVKIVKSITALGRITPEGGLVSLSVPSGAGGGNDVVQRWFAQEGQDIRKGQLLVQMSSYSQLKAELDQAKANLEASRVLLPFLMIGQNRGGALFKEGAITEEELGKAYANVESRKAAIQEAQAGVVRARVLLQASQIRSPFDGTLIRIFSTPGMRESSDGLAMLGKTNAMEVWAQVYQSDIAKLRPGQSAKIRPESGGFTGVLQGKLKAITGQVSARDLFATTNNSDVNARVVLVKLALDPADGKRVKRLSGLNVLVQFDR